MVHIEIDYRRLLKVLWCEEPDRVPLYEHFVDIEVIEAMLNEKLRTLDLSKDSSKLKYVRGLIKFYRGLGYDYVPLELPLKLLVKNVLVAEDTAPLSRGLRSWRDELHGTIETREDFESYEWPEPEDAVDYRLMELLCRELPEDMCVVGGVAGGVLEHVMKLMGFTPFFRALYTDRTLLRNMFDTVGKLIFEVDSILVEFEKVEVLRMGDDMGFRTGTFISPHNLREYVLPWHKKCVELAHKHGKPFILHSCGNLESIMEDLINFVGIDAKHSFEDAIMPVTEVKRKYGERIAILGGVDVNKLSYYPSDKFTEYVKNIIRECAPGGGYALGSGNTITNYVDLRNYRIMIDLCLKYGNYPIPS